MNQARTVGDQACLAADKICLLWAIVLGVISLVRFDERALWTLPLIPMLALDIGYWLWRRRRAEA